MPVLHSLAHQPSDSVPPTVMPVLHSLAPQQHLRLLRLHLMCAVLFVGTKTKQSEARSFRPRPIFVAAGVWRCRGSDFTFFFLVAHALFCRCVVLSCSGVVVDRPKLLGEVAVNFH